MGKGDLTKWFNKTRNELGLHAINLSTILYESLEGLRSKDAQELRGQFAEHLQRLRGMFISLSLKTAYSLDTHGLGILNIKCSH